MKSVANVVRTLLPGQKPSLSAKPSKKQSHRRLHFEPLEERQMLSISPAGNLVDDTNALISQSMGLEPLGTMALPDFYEAPGTGETTSYSVMAASSAIMPTAASPTLNGVTLNITADNFDAENEKWDFANLTSIKNCNITANGVTLDFTNCTELENVILTATNGGVIKFPEVIRYSTNTNNYYYWRASGTDSRIEMSALTTISGSGSNNYFYIYASGGGVVDLSKVTTTSQISYFRLSSTGNGSLIDISGLESFTSGTTYLEIDDTSEIVFANTITELDGVELYGYGKLTNFDATKISSIKNSTISTRGIMLDFVNCTELENTNLYAQNGGLIKFPKVTSYAGTSARTWQATGASSRIEMAALKTMRIEDNTWLSISATNNGTINLLAVTSIDTDLVYLTIQSGGVILLSSAITDTITELSGVTLEITSLENLYFDPSKVTSIKNSTITANGVPLDFVNCAVLENTTLTAQGGGVIKFPKETTYTGSGTRTWRATGAGSRLDLSGITNLDTNLVYLSILTVYFTTAVAR